MVGLGFCDSNESYHGMPGWDIGSWGLHGDDGHLFFEGDKATESSDLGQKSTFQASDVIGCGMDMETGEGFCVKNGKRLDLGELAIDFYHRCPSRCANAALGNPPFKWDKFKYGKLYPCVGIVVDEDSAGLRVRVNLGSKKHSFKYRGLKGN